MKKREKRLLLGYYVRVDRYSTTNLFHMTSQTSHTRQVVEYEMAHDSCCGLYSRRFAAGGNYSIVLAMTLVGSDVNCQ